MGNLDEQPARIAGDQPNSNPESDSPDVIAWGRPLGYEPEQPLHALVGVNDGGSNITVCRGRWSATESSEIFFGRHVTQYPKCVACCSVTGDKPSFDYPCQVDELDDSIDSRFDDGDLESPREVR